MVEIRIMKLCLKFDHKIEFDVKISKNDYNNSLKNKYGRNLWGAANLWFNDKIGAEYNLCYHFNINKNHIFDTSAIYFMEYDDVYNGWYTSRSKYIPYSIDFNKDNWKELLIFNMIGNLFKIINL